MRNAPSTPAWMLLLLGAALALALVLSLGVGVYPVAPGTVARILGAFVLHRPAGVGPGWTGREYAVVAYVRLPRAVLATLAGVALSLGGAALQGLFRNPLVGPDIVGVSAGSACGGVLAILLAWPAAALVGAAFAGGLAAVAATTALSRLGGGSGVLRLVLAGVVVGAFGSALVSLAEYLAAPDTTLPALVYWLLGSFAAADASKVVTLASAVLVGGGVLIPLRWRLNLLALGETDAAGLGVRVERLRWLVVALVALMVAGQVAVSGIVGWIGLVTPHLARRLVGPDHRRLLPASALLGGLLMLVVDDVARTAGPQELPVGLVTALVGTPVFALLLWRTRSGGWGAED